MKLRTKLGDDPQMSMRYEWFRDLHGLSHDAAVAHALVRAISELSGYGEDGDVKCFLETRAAEILRDDFGITED